MVAAVGCVLLAAGFGGTFRALDDAFVDALDAHMLRTPATDVAVVEIDAKSVRAIDRWPWNRRTHAALIERLAGAHPRGVFFDVDFSVPSGDAAADAALADALAEAEHRVVLPAFWQPAGVGATGGFVLTEPLPALAREARVGLVNVSPGPDGLVRDMVHRDASRAAPMASAVALLASPRNALQAIASDRAYPIDFRISPATFPRYSYVDVLEGRVATERLADKVVFVGATALELGDTVPVPIHRALPGVVLQALAYQTLRDGIPVRVPGAVGIALAVLLFGALLPLASASVGRALASTILGVGAVAASAALLHATTPLIVPVAAAIAAVVASGVVGLSFAVDRHALAAWLGARKLERREALISSVLATSVDGIVVFGRDGVVRDANAASAVLLGTSLSALRGANVRHMLPSLPIAANGGNASNGTRHELSLERNGAKVAIETTVSQVTLARGGVLYTAILRDVTERKQHQALLNHQATHDALTGLPNRVLLTRALQALAGDEPAALFMLDLDRFKDVNDTLGHATGDAVLAILGQRLTNALPDRHLIARIGGDEFAVLVPGSTSRVELESLANIVLERVRAPVKTSGHMIEVGASIGVALRPHHGTDGGALLQHADVAMYAAKHAKTGVEFYRPEADRSSMRHLQLAGALRTAIAADALELFYQPKVRLSDMACVGVEALVRWNHPELGAVPPHEFVPLAENGSLIGPLTRWVVDRALTDRSHWRFAGRSLDLAINLSARHFSDPEFIAEILVLIGARGFEPERLELEITETALMSEPDRAMVVMERLRAAGVRVAIDDFGTGFSSLSYLKHLSLSTLKIDRTFIKDICDDAHDVAIVQSTLKMAKSLGMSVVAEGIETQAQCDALRRLGCDLGQGFWFAKPMPAAHVDPWCEAWANGVARLDARRA